MAPKAAGPLTTHYRPSDASSLTFWDDAEGEKAASKIAVVLKRLGSSTYDVAIKIITDIGSAAVKKILGL